MQPNSSFAEQIDRILREPLLCAREAASDGRRVIGYVGSDCPVELLIAAGALPVRLGGIATTTARADTYLESSFHPETRVVAEQWLSGALNFIDAVVFPRSNDSAQRLYYYLCELQRTDRCAGPKPILFDTAIVSRRTSVEHTLQSTRRLAAELGAHHDLSAAISRTNKREQLLKRLHEQRIAKLALHGSEVHRILRAAEFDWGETFDAMLSEWLSTAPRIHAAGRILLAGTAPPDERIHLVVEAQNSVVVGECTESSRRQLNSVGDSADAALAAIAQRHHTAQSPALQMMNSPDFLVNAARAVDADSVILWAIEEDEALPWEVARQAQSLRAAGFSVLSLTRQPWLANEVTLQSVAEFARAQERRQ